MKFRQEFGALVETYKKIGVGVEVGTRYGLFARTICKTWTGRIHCIDLWADREIYDVCNVVLEGTNATQHRIDSVRGAKLFADASLDWIYIDACHEYESVVADIAAWYPKVRPGGVIAGHDYLSEFEWGVVEAVDEFAHQHNYTINLTTDDWWEGRNYATWWWIKR